MQSLGANNSKRVNPEESSLPMTLRHLLTVISFLSPIRVSGLSSIACRPANVEAAYEYLCSIKPLLFFPR